MTTTASQPLDLLAQAESDPALRLTLEDVDKKYEQLGCLGHGGFGSVFLARKRSEASSRRYVAIKVLKLTDDEDDDFSRISVEREIDAMVSLNKKNSREEDGVNNASGNNNNDNSSSSGGNEETRDLAIIFFREWFVSHDFKLAFLVTNFVEGGTLADMIDALAANNINAVTVPDAGGKISSSSSSSSLPLPPSPLSERRIAWYLLQLCEALAFAHSRDVYHHDIKSPNILIDAWGGGKLILTDFGTSVTKPGQDKLGYTVAYASPELLMAERNGTDLSLVNPLGVDAFGLGCVALELLMCQRLIDVSTLSGRTIADVVVMTGGLESVCAQMNPSTSAYSSVLREDMVRSLLHPDPSLRASPSLFPYHLRHDPKSPLLCPSLHATHPRVRGVHLTVDNIELGCFVQRGPDWEDSDADGRDGSIGVVIKLDPDALYTEVAWPNGTTDSYRIGANCRMELIVGAAPLAANGMSNGFLFSRDPSKYDVGSTLTTSSNSAANGMVITSVAREGIFITPPPSYREDPPIDIRMIPRIPRPPENPTPPMVHPRIAEQAPSFWDLSKGNLCPVSRKEYYEVLGQFHSTTGGGLPSTKYKVQSIKRVQSIKLWESYVKRREVIAMENWGYPNERRLFHGTSRTDPQTILCDKVGFDPRFASDTGRFGRGSYFAQDAGYSHCFSYRPAPGTYQLFVARVALGRVDQRLTRGGTTTQGAAAVRRPHPGCHSVGGLSNLQNGVGSFIHVIYDTGTQAMPEYLITYVKLSK